MNRSILKALPRTALRFQNVVVLILILVVATIVSPRSQVAKKYQDADGAYLLRTEEGEGERLPIFLNENGRECVNLQLTRRLENSDLEDLEILRPFGAEEQQAETVSPPRVVMKARLEVRRDAGRLRIVGGEAEVRPGKKSEYALRVGFLTSMGPGPLALVDSEGNAFVYREFLIPAEWDGDHWTVFETDLPEGLPVEFPKGADREGSLAVVHLAHLAKEDGRPCLKYERTYPITARNVIWECETREEIVFLQPTSIGDVLRQTSVVGIMAVGMTLVILTAGIDLSVGSLLAFAAVVFSLVTTEWIGHPFFIRILPGIGISSTFAVVFVAFIVTLFATTLLGTVNGLLVSKGRIQPFIVTLSMMLGARGLAQLISNERLIKFEISEEVMQNRPDLAEAIRGLQGFVLAMGSREVMITLFAVASIVFTVVLSWTRFGRHVIAVGGNEKAAGLSGIRVDRVKTFVYAICGFLCAIAGILQMGRENQADFNTGKAYELQVIAAVVLGGTSLMGGRGTVWGSVVGAITIQVIRKTMDLRQVRDAWQDILLGVIIVLAVLIQRKRREG